MGLEIVNRALSHLINSHLAYDFPSVDTHLAHSDQNDRICPPKSSSPHITENLIQSAEVTGSASGVISGYLGVF